jgi:hypothetical protein
MRRRGTGSGVTIPIREDSTNLQEGTPHLSSLITMEEVGNVLHVRSVEKCTLKFIDVVNPDISPKIAEFLSTINLTRTATMDNRKQHRHVCTH